LRTFERAIVPLKSVRGYQAPTAEVIRSQFAFCSDPLNEQDRRALSARNRRTNSCASTSAAEEIACHLGKINARLNEMSGERPDEPGGSVERALRGEHRALGGGDPDHAGATGAPSAGGAGARQSGRACRDALTAARHLAAGEGGCSASSPGASSLRGAWWPVEFAPGQAIRVPERIIEQRNPWSGVPGCIYYGDPDATARSCS
jgi:hypothetical protein